MRADPERPFHPYPLDPRVRCSRAEGRPLARAQQAPQTSYLLVRVPLHAALHANYRCGLGDQDSVQDRYGRIL